MFFRRKKEKTQPWLSGQDEVNHLNRSMLAVKGLKSWHQLGKALAMVGWVLENGPTRWGHVGVNELAASACLTRAFDDIRAALRLAQGGHYAASRTVLRSSFESATTARMLAMEPELADRWFRKGEWFPDKEVRAWADYKDDEYRAFYRSLSADAHPTAAANLRFLDVGGRTYAPLLSVRFDRRRFEDLMSEITASALLLAFATRNCMASPDALPPDWYRDLKKLAEEVAPDESFDHLERDWSDEQDRWERVQDQILGPEDLQKLLSEHPNSMTNIKKRAENEEGASVQSRSDLQP